MEIKTNLSFLFKPLFILGLLLSPDLLTAQAIEATLLGNWDDPSLPVADFIDNRYNDVWGVEVNGVEYAVIGSCNGVHFINIDDPSGPVEVAFAEGAHVGSQIIHRDYHSYQNYLYTVADEGINSTLQIIDFSGLPNSVEIVYDSNEFFTFMHNIFIDEENARLYTSGGVTVLSLEDPEQPVYLDQLSTNGIGVPGYAHDIFVKDNILYMNNGNSGMYVVDYNDVDNPIALGSMTAYPQSGYNHAGWLSDDGEHYFLCDETHGTDVKSVSVSDMSDIHVVDLFNSASTSPDHIAHNAMVRGDLLFVSYYYDGLQVFDISDPENVIRKYHYDTYPQSNSAFFHGAWGIYALLPSGRVLISDMQTGLYVLELPADVGIYASQSNFESCINTTIDFEILIGNGFTSGVDLVVDGVPSGVTVDFDGANLDPGDLVDISVSGLTSESQFQLSFTATDGSDVTTQDVDFDILETIIPISLSLPNDGVEELSLTPTFFWQSAALSSYLLEISTSAEFEAASIVVSENVNGTSYSVSTELNQNTLHYWRLSSAADCANSEIRTFTTKMIVGVDDLNVLNFDIFPNPVKDNIHIALAENRGEQTQIQLSDISGKLVGNWTKESSALIVLETPEHLSGLFLITVKTETGSTTKKLIID